MKKIILTLTLGTAMLLTQAQTYTPVSLSGYNHDVIAETFPSSLATTDTVLDGSSYVMYSQAFAVAGGFSGGLPNNGQISDGGNTRQFQLAPYTGNNALTVMRNASRTFSLTTPAAYKALTLLAFSTEGSSQVTITVNFTDGTSTTYINAQTLPDWFTGTPNAVTSGFGRVTRLATAIAVNGPPSSPTMYYLDINLNCVDRKKPIQSIRINNVTTTGSNAPFPNTVVLAVSGQTDTQAITTSVTPASCGVNNGSASVTVTGNSGPYSISWNTSPAQTTPAITNLAAGSYTVSVTDGAGCVTPQTLVVAQLPSPTAITATATPAVVCSGGTTQLSVSATGGSLATYTWTPGNATTATVTVTPSTTTTYNVLGTDASGCPYSRQVTVTVNQRPAAPTVPNVQVCGGNSGTLAVQLPQTGYTYNWYTSATGGSAVFTGPNYTVSNANGTYTYYVEAVSNGCASSARTAVTLSLFPAATANAGTDRTIIAGDVIQLDATGSAGTYLWTPATALSATNVLQPLANPTATTTYTLTVTNAQGCAQSDAVTITVLPYCVKIMDAFTPNGDGTNDLWRITNGNCISRATVRVYNRYGAEVYRSDDYRNDWNGTYKGDPLPDGTYYYVVRYVLLNNMKVELKGNVTILR